MERLVGVILVIFACQNSLVVASGSGQGQYNQGQYSEGTTDQEREQFLRIHNYVCRIVEPPAANMNLFTIDEDLACLAQEWADKCIRGNCMPMNSYEDTIGMNVAYTDERPTLGDGIRNIVLNWFNEREQFNYANNTCETRGGCDHYTQVVWAHSRTMACAISSKPCRRSGYYTTVCLYSPKGNIKGQSPYIAGPSCSQCEPDRRNCQNRLCAP